MTKKITKKTATKKAAAPGPRKLYVWTIYHFAARFEVTYKKNGKTYAYRDGLNFIRRFVGSGSSDESIAFVRQIKSLKTLADEKNGTCADVLENSFWKLTCNTAQFTKQYRGFLLDELMEPAGPQAMSRILGKDQRKTDAILRLLARAKLIERIPWNGLPAKEAATTEGDEAEKRESPDQSRPVQTSPDQTSPDQSRPVRTGLKNSNDNSNDKRPSANDNINVNKKNDKRQKKNKKKPSPPTTQEKNKKKPSPKKTKARQKTETTQAPPTTRRETGKKPPMPTEADGSVAPTTTEVDGGGQRASPGAPCRSINPYNSEATRFADEIFQALWGRPGRTALENDLREFGNYTHAWNLAQLSSLSPSQLANLKQKSVKEAHKIKTKRSLGRVKNPGATWRSIFDKRLKSMIRPAAAKPRKKTAN